MKSYRGGPKFQYFIFAYYPKMFVDFLQNEIKYILDNTDITARKFCAVVFQPKCGDWEEVNNWHIDTSHTAEKPEPIEPELPPVKSIQSTI